jgi:hypothetical protein
MLNSQFFGCKNIYGINAEVFQIKGLRLVVIGNNSRKKFCGILLLLHKTYQRFQQFRRKVILTEAGVNNFTGMY